MKKSFITLICFMAMFAQNVFAQSFNEHYIYLLHEGKTTLFRESTLQDAVNAAVKGDTIILSAGTFSGYVTIDKAITLIGAGVDSYVKGIITVKIPYNPKLTNSLMQNLKCDGLNVDAYVEDLNINKCEIGALQLKSNAENAVITSCNIIKLYNTEKNVHFVNSVVSLDNSNFSNKINLINCNIIAQHNTANSHSLSLQMINCIYYTWTTDWGMKFSFTEDAVARYCLMNTKPSKNENCYTNSFIYESDEFKFTDIDGAMTKESLASKGCYGYIDGIVDEANKTVVGVLGGRNPYSLETTSPKFVDEKLEVDHKNEKVKVTIKLSAN